MSNDLCYRLFYAVRHGDIGATKTLLESYDLLNERGWCDGHILLHEALENRHEKIARFLLVRDAVVNCKSKCPPKTPLHVAATNGYVEVVDMLVGRNADVYAEDQNDKTPIHCAVEKGNYEIVKSLLKRMVSLEIKSDTGMTPLQLAAHLGRTQIVEALLDHGANVNSTCTSSRQQGNTPLHFAAAQGDETTVAFLLDRGADVNAVNEERVTPLHITTEKNRYEAAKLLLEHGANLDTCDKYSRTILGIAVENANLQMTELILNHQPDCINMTTQNGETALHVAASQGYTDIVKFLLKREAMVNVFDNENTTPLHLCAWNGYDEILEMLLDNGACVHATTERGGTALHAAISRENPRKYYRSARSRSRQFDELDLFSDLTTNDYHNFDRGDFSPPLDTCASKNYDNTLKILLDRGAIINAKLTDGDTPLLLAVRGHHIEAVKLLIHYGADVDDRNNIGETSLHVAVKEDDLKIFKVLLEVSENVDSREELGRTPLHIASTTSNLRIVQLLLDRDSDVNLTSNDDENTPLDHAVLHYHECKRFVFDSDPYDYICYDRLDSYVRSCKGVAIFVGHIAKLIALNRYVSKKNLRDATAAAIFEDIPNNCINEIEIVNEVESMRMKYIGESRVSFYDILTAGENALVHYARNESIVDTLERGNCRDEFRLYSRMIDCRFKNAQKRRRLLDSSLKSLSSLVGYNLPDLAINGVFNYLSNRDMENLIKAGSAITHKGHS